ncbi:hypothetical protein [Actinopolymorpha pittospori]|uniref:Uncharacterized protein n=1 Tax=Actinopolymorpha pittospori TaxID=648752 RepID=A0A927N8D9_9ACTN|nr:hypothetical protein [Actinopolymorpha pittospori]MBE1612103.1 hypothetical protein [Actinopolymorpha pittospori]
MWSEFARGAIVAIPEQNQRSDRRPTGPSSAPAGNRTTFRPG